jgi:site-specific DNA-methyltransferase (cytosine-N4-specific)
MAKDGIKVQTCVTSPPYYGLRDYGTAEWEGGNVDCDHIEKIQSHSGERSNRDQTSQIFKYKGLCKKCGAVSVDGQIGLEQTPQEFINNLVEVFACVWDILEDDGTLWVNLGDSYANNSSQASNNGRAGFGNPREKVVNRIGNGYKQKDLMGMPWRLAFALQDFGWYLRQDIIWHKPNPMPESVTDRCTKSHEYIFLLTKNAKYYFDADSIKENAINTEEQQIAKRNKKQHRANAQEHEAKFVQHNFSEIKTVYEKRNKRDVWSVPVKPYSGAHFAVYPPELIEPCILAGSRIGDIVLDPFFGSGTTGQVSQNLGRKWIGCELNKNYEALQNERLSQQGFEL